MCFYELQNKMAVYDDHYGSHMKYDMFPVGGAHVSAVSQLEISQ